ncbi:organic cation transporter protein-like [Chrysoperla carnea]|uniref:organic cation transporter protein-like n=1 Tax=Chrysoperla carnea TaxID=189513 RepID=UPI001D096B49|nr:organic cation transporter protein-like [Chrysoperla carnea]
MPPKENLNIPTSTNQTTCGTSNGTKTSQDNEESDKKNLFSTNIAFVNSNNNFPLKKLPNIQATTANKTAIVPNDNSADKKDIDFDDILPYIGEFGNYQRILFMLMIPFAFSVAFVYFTQIFITVIPENYWCYVPELSNFTIEQRKSLAIPKKLQSDGQFGYDHCLMYDINYEKLLEQPEFEIDPNTPVVSCKYGWEFDFSDIPYPTISTELEWVCDKGTYPSIAQAIFFGGAITGGLLFGWIADSYGRIPALIGCNMVGAIAGIATIFFNNFLGFCICRFFVGMAFDNCFTMMYILVLEYVGPQWRTFVANMSIAIFFTFAACILPWLAYFIADWRILCIVTSLPLFAALPAPWILPESARWLVSKGKLDKAFGILRKFERINGTAVEPKMYQDFSDTCNKILKEEELNKNYSVLNLFKSSRLRHTTILLIIIWMVISLCFDGHVRNVGSLGLDLFLTFTIASATELPADTFLTLTLDKWGRRWLACGSMVFSGVFSLLATMVPVGVPSATLAIMGRFSVNISYNIGLQYIAELLPTVVRAQGVALVHIMGYVSSIIAPFIVLLADISPMLPLLVLGIIGIVGGVLCLCLPETLDQDLPQTLQDGENFGRDQKFWDFPCCPRIREEDNIGYFRRTSAASVYVSKRSIYRASVRGEIRSSMINRRSEIRLKKSVNGDENC